MIGFWENFWHPERAKAEHKAGRKIIHDAKNEIQNSIGVARKAKRASDEALRVATKAVKELEEHYHKKDGAFEK